MDRSAREGRLHDRLLLPTERSDVTVSWRRERDSFNLALWHDDVCVASARLAPEDAAELAAFLTRHLGGRLVWAPS